MHRPAGLFIVLALGVAGCSPPWTVIERSGPPSALRGAQGVTVSWDPSSLYVEGVPMPEAQSTMSPDERSRLDESVRRMGATFLGELAESLDVPLSVASGDVAEGEVRLLVRPVELERGANGAVGSSTVLVTRLDWILDGDVVDAVQVRVSQPPSMRRPSASERMRIAAGQSAQLAARFFTEARR